MTGRARGRCAPRSLLALPLLLAAVRGALVPNFAQGYNPSDTKEQEIQVVRGHVRLVGTVPWNFPSQIAVAARSVLNRMSGLERSVLTHTLGTQVGVGENGAPIQKLDCFYMIATPQGCLSGPLGGIQAGIPSFGEQLMWELGLTGAGGGADDWSVGMQQPFCEPLRLTVHKDDRYWFAPCVGGVGADCDPASIMDEAAVSAAGGGLDDSSGGGGDSSGSSGGADGAGGGDAEAVEGLRPDVSDEDMVWVSGPLAPIPEAESPGGGGGGGVVVDMGPDSPCWGSQEPCHCATLGLCIWDGAGCLPRAGGGNAVSCTSCPSQPWCPAAQCAGAGDPCACAAELDGWERCLVCTSISGCDDEFETQLGVSGDGLVSLLSSGDFGGPRVQSYEPENGETATSAPLKVVLAFSQPVVVPDGSLAVRLVDMEASTFQELTLTAPRLGVAGNELSLDFADETKASALYSLVIDAGLVTDVQGNRFGGLLPGNYQFRMAPAGTVAKEGAAAAAAAADGEFPVLTVVVVALSVLVLCAFGCFVYTTCEGIQDEIQDMGLKKTISGRLRRDMSAPNLWRDRSNASSAAQSDASHDVSYSDSVPSRMSLWSHSAGVNPFRSGGRKRTRPEPPGGIPDRPGEAKCSWEEGQSMHPKTGTLHGAALSGPGDRPADDGGVPHATAATHEPHKDTRRQGHSEF